MTIDWWTLGLQTLNVVVLIWLLKRFFWTPLAGMIAARRTLAGAALAEAEAARKKAAADLAAIEQTRAGFAAEHAATLAAAQAEAKQARDAALKALGAETAKMRDEARAALAAERAAAETEWEHRAGTVAIGIAGRLAARLDGPAVRAAFLGWLEAELRRQPAGAVVPPVVLTSAAALSAEEQAASRAMLARVLGAEVEASFAVDPALIAGLELAGAHLVVRNSWRDDLARITNELGHGG
jgi:F-type H+-transporting ATPase subunit b